MDKTFLSNRFTDTNYVLNKVANHEGYCRQLHECPDPTTTKLSERFAHSPNKIPLF